MTRNGLILVLAWSILLGGASYKFGVRVQKNADLADQARSDKRDRKLAARKDRKALAAGVRTEHDQAATDSYFQRLRADYETDQHNNPGIGCVLDPVSLRRWNEANTQSADAAAGEPAGEVSPPAEGEGGGERRE